MYQLVNKTYIDMTILSISVAILILTVGHIFYQYAYPTNILISVVISIVILISVHLFFSLSLLYG